MLEELEAVLSRPRLSRFITPAAAESVKRLFLQATAHFEPGAAPRICRDESDDYLLALSLASGSDVLVTRDADLLVLERHGGTAIIYPARFLQLLEAAAPPKAS